MCTVVVVPGTLQKLLARRLVNTRAVNDCLDVNQTPIFFENLVRLTHANTHARPLTFDLGTLIALHQTPHDCQRSHPEFDEEEGVVGGWWWAVE